MLDRDNIGKLSSELELTSMLNPNGFETRRRAAEIEGFLVETVESSRHQRDLLRQRGGRQVAGHAARQKRIAEKQLNDLRILTDETTVFWPGKEVGSMSEARDYLAHVGGAGLMKIGREVEELTDSHFQAMAQWIDTLRAFRCSATQSRPGLSEKLSVRVTQRQFAAVTRSAGEENAKVSEWGRQALRRYLAVDHREVVASSRSASKASEILHLRLSVEESFALAAFVRRHRLNRAEVVRLAVREACGNPVIGERNRRPGV